MAMVLPFRYLKLDLATGTLDYHKQAESLYFYILIAKLHQGVENKCNCNKRLKTNFCHVHCPYILCDTFEILNMGVVVDEPYEHKVKYK